MRTQRISKRHQILYPLSLNKPGKVLVRTGDVVNQGDVIAETHLPERFLVYDIVNQLKVKPEEVEKYIYRLNGESFIAGDVIAQKPGLFSRLFRAKQDGKVVSIRDGKVVLALGEAVESLTAPFSGVVSELIAGRGAVIAAVGAIVEGLAGEGENACGELVHSNLGFDRNKRLEDAENLAEKICYCETIGHARLVRELEAAGVSGLVVGTLEPDAFQALNESGLPWILLSGFGVAETDQDTLDILMSMSGKQVHLLRGMEGQGALLFCPSNETDSPSLFTAQAENTLNLGDRVKLFGQPHLGRVGEVVDICEQDETSSSGIQYRAVVVKLADEVSVKVPVENLVKLLD